MADIILKNVAFPKDEDVLLVDIHSDQKAFCYSWSATWVDAIPAEDAQPVVRCKDCVYWQKPQIQLDDGTYRDYLPGEYEGGPFGLGVTSDVGINIGSFCAKYNTDHQNRIPQFMAPDDFCSKGYRAMDGGDT